MSKKNPSVPPCQNWFAGSRNYNLIAESEKEFFKALLEQRNEVNIGYKLKTAIKDVEHFISEPIGRTLEILVELDGFETRTEKPQKLYLGTKLDPPRTKSSAEVSYFLCIAEDDKLVVKLHADYDFDPDKPEKKPSPHCQVGGRLPAKMRGKYSAWAWNEEADKPRMPALPFSTALLWHWAFREFPQYDEAELAKAPWWLKLIRDAEQRVLKPFFSDGYLLSNNERNTGVIDALYFPTVKK